VKVALKTDTPILPVGVHGADKALPRGAVIPRPREITVHFGDVIDLADYRARQTQPLTDEDLAEMVRQEVIRLCKDRED
jgi:1-acyl-sn-glycerol-3-phosphate acyltransferase